jgi:type I restriction enzyme S subunit
LDLRCLPVGWNWIALQNIAKISGGLIKKPQREKYPLKMPYLRVANVYAGQLSLAEIKYIGVNKGEVNKLLLNKEDLLIVEGNGSLDQIGRVALWEGQIAPCLHQNHIIKIRLAEIANSRYALYWLLSPDGRSYIKSVASSTSGLYTLSISKVSMLPIPLPTSAERHQIVEEIEQRLSILEKIEKYLPTAFLMAERLRQSLLKNAFEGRLIPQNPNDEPAEKLLENMKAERFNNKKSKINNQLELSRYVK